MPTTQRKPILLDFEKPLVELEDRISQIRELAEQNDVDVASQISQLEARADQLRQEIFASLTPAQRLQVARHPRRPSTLDYIQAISDEWLELHGDRGSGKEVVRLDTGNGPHEVAVSPDGRTAVACNYGTRGAPGRTLTVIDLVRVRRDLNSNGHYDGICW